MGLISVGCGGSRDEDIALRGDTMTAVEGRVRIAGNTPMEQVLVEPRSEGEHPVTVRGTLRSELLRLSGATVRVSGIREDRHLRAIDYEILEIAGRKPLVGTLERGRDAALWIRKDTGERVRLRAAPDELRTQDGGRVWVILDAEGAVKGYGVLREA